VSLSAEETRMASFASARDTAKDHLLTPQNSALIIIDPQPVQVSPVASRSKRELVANITALTTPREEPP
jgi:hypothetical protein